MNRIGRIFPLIVCSLVGIFSAVSARTSRESLAFLEKRQAEVVEVATNLFAFASRLDTMQEQIDQLAVAGFARPVLEDEKPSSEKIGSIPYWYFRAGEYRGITNGHSHVILGQRCRYGTLTACGRDFAEFDGFAVYGLGVNHDKRTDGSTGG